MFSYSGLKYNPFKANLANQYTRKKKINICLILIHTFDSITETMLGFTKEILWEVTKSLFHVSVLLLPTLPILRYFKNKDDSVFASDTSVSAFMS